MFTVFYKYLDKKILKKIFSGILVVDKKAGVTSHDEVFYLKKIFKNFLRKSVLKIDESIIKKVKVGHSGTLDPKVTGVLVCGFGKATKVLEYMLESDKWYLTEILFHQEIEENLFKENVKKFIGQIKQLPPRKSSVKRVLREREVYDIEILDFYKNKRGAKFLAKVQKGTYIRKLCHDLGLKMNITASMGDLRRIKAGVFNENTCKLIKLKDFEKYLLKYSESKNIFTRLYYFKKIIKHLYSIDDTLKGFPKIILKKGVDKFILSGSALYWPGVESFEGGFKAGQNVFMKNNKGKVIAVGKSLIDSSLYISKKDFSKKGTVVKTKKVFIK